MQQKQKIRSSGHTAQVNGATVPHATNGAVISHDELPPHDEDAERALIGCALLNPALLLKELANVKEELFYDLRHKNVWRVIRAMNARRKAVDLVTLASELKKTNEAEDCGGLAYVTALQDAPATPTNWHYYFEIVRDRFTFRKALEVCTEHALRAKEWQGDAHSFMQGIGSDLETLTALQRTGEKPVLEVMSADDLKQYEAPQHLRLIGDNEVCMGYEGISIVAGPGSSGKSLAVAAAALAGAIGPSVSWFKRPVHRQFKTLILQAENGKSRLKFQIERMMELHPKHAKAIRENIFFSAPPEGGLAFHRPEFRAAVRREVERLQPSLVVLDTWAQVAAEDAAREVMEKLGEIRSCFPSGDDCPALMIVAHTSKPRPEQVRKGRALSFLVSGSVALINAARCVHMILPWSEDLEDDRIYFACPKLNNGQMYGASVWKRRLGTFFEHDADTDPKNWGDDDKPSKEDERAVTKEMITQAFGSESVLKKAAIAKRMKEKFGVPDSTTYAALPGGTRGYLSDCLEVTKEGWIQIKKESK